MQRAQFKTPRLNSYLFGLSKPARGIQRAVAVALVVGFGLGGGAALADDVTAGLDYWETVSPTWLDFGQSPLPADFFGPGSDPFDGVIALRGEPLDPGTSGDSSTIVERLEDASLPDPYTSFATIDVEMIELQLVAIEPIHVTFFGGGIDSFFDVVVTLDPDSPSTGQMTIHHQTVYGGVYDNIWMYVFPLIDFIPLGPMGEPRIWDPEFMLESTASYSWQHEIPYPPPYPGEGPNFFPLDRMDLALWTPGGVVGGHGSIPRGPIGCCFPDGSCVDILEEDCIAMGGRPMGQACTGTMLPCCLPDGSCANMDPLCCEFDYGGVVVPTGGCAGSVEACCDGFPPLGCKDADAMCCAVVESGTPMGGGTACEGDGDQSGTDDACEFCGDGTCIPPEDQCNCPEDCGTPPAAEVPSSTCQDTIDNDCDTLTDCDDPDCETDPACAPQPILKWLQPPDPNPTTAIEILAQYPPGPGVVLADDFLCEVTGPLMEIHVWGSWLYDQPPGGNPGNVTFVLSIHSDIPEGPMGWSVPGELLWMHTFTPGTFDVVPYWQTPQGWYDPSTGWYEPGVDNECWEYTFYVPPGNPFVQQGTDAAPIVYWLDVQAFPELESYFGWKTTEPPFHWNDDAVWAEGLDPPLGPWWELYYPPMHPLMGVSLDMAFAIYGFEQEPVGACCCDDLTCVEVTEDNCGTGCTYLGDGTACSGIVEACCDNDTIACSNMDRVCCPSFNGTPSNNGMRCAGTIEGCCDPAGGCADYDPVCCSTVGGAPQGATTACTAVEACCLDFGTIPDCINVDPLCCDDQNGDPSPTGEPLCLGDGNGSGVDDACEVPQACCLPDGSCIDTPHMACVGMGGDPQGLGTSCGDGTVVCNPIKWVQPPLYNPQSEYPECFWGWDAQSIYELGPIAADDWLCTDEQPITDIHWWGSYELWDGGAAPPVAPVRFHIAIWTDDPEPPYSHPSRVIHEWYVPRAVLNERTVACDFYPGMMPTPDSCFRYDFQIPQAEWFHQGPASTVYWISIAAIYDEMVTEFPWGWKTREPYYNDDAVWIYYPLMPVDGSLAIETFPILGGGWDLSFVLTTGEAGANPPAPCFMTGGAPCHDDADCSTPVGANRAVCMDDCEDPVGRWCYVPKNRYISLDLSCSEGELVAYQVALTTMMRCSGDLSVACLDNADCAVAGGTCVNHPDAGTVTKWIGEPYIGQGPMPSGCFPQDDCSGMLFAQLQDGPWYHDGTAECVHVEDCEIVPAAVYEVRSTSDGVVFSDPLTIGTVPKPHLQYADVCGPAFGVPPVYTPPDGFINVVDLQAFVKAQQNLPGAPNTTWLDIHGVAGFDCDTPLTGCIVPQQILNVGDQQTIQKGMQGKTYTNTPGQVDPGTCPWIR